MRYLYFVRQMPGIRIISFSLLVVLAIQILPVSQAGDFIGSDQSIELLSQDDSESNLRDGNPVSLLSLYSHEIAYKSSDGKAMKYIHTSAQLPSFYIADIIAPPPDII